MVERAAQRADEASTARLVGREAVVDAGLLHRARARREALGQRHIPLFVLVPIVALNRHVKQDCFRDGVGEGVAFRSVRDRCRRPVEGQLLAVHVEVPLGDVNLRPQKRVQTTTKIYNYV